MTLDVISISPENEQKPEFVFVLLHGWGANYHDLTALIPMLNLPSCLYLFPNAPYAHYQVEGGRAWYALEDNNEGIEASLDQFYQWLLSLEDSTEIPLSKTIVGGFSQGGAMSLDVGLQLPVAAVVSLSGYLHFQPTADRNPFPPTFISHGKRDSVVPINTAREAKRKLEAVRVSVEYQEFDIAHEIIPAQMHLVRDFVLKSVHFQ
ncbi:alpha/beta hydrolase [Geminocystis sp. GBBB08]|uniref:alpha/beta hydrolase n=1 Tax=Geminocystis sp. GBBB08 TaxID=2604140 RepID=UPI0027E2CCEB|nr:alpha/beta hydrolase [Geminocystis sp. GBBB08]MBL1210411.1 alpha/beta hydrolase [Geminocystis sp. GBBB08]